MIRSSPLIPVFLLFRDKSIASSFGEMRDGVEELGEVVEVGEGGASPSKRKSGVPVGVEEAAGLEGAPAADLPAKRPVGSVCPSLHIPAPP